MYVFRLATCRSLGFKYAELLLRKSAKSMQSKKPSDDGDAHTTAEQCLNGEVEFSAATPALLALASQWASTDSTRSAAAAARGQACKFLDIFLARTIAAASMQFDADGCVLNIEHGLLATGTLLDRFPALRRTPTFCSQNISMRSALVGLLKYQQKSARASARLRGESMQCFHILVGFLTHLVEYRMPESRHDAWQDLPVLRGAKGKSRRISQGTKLSFRATAVATTGIHGAAQVVGVARNLKRARGENPSDLPSERSAKRFARDEMWNYLLAGQQMWEGCSHLNLVCDGCRVDSDELVSYLFYSPEKQLGMWGPPQVVIVEIVSSTRSLSLWGRNGGTSCRAPGGS